MNNALELTQKQIEKAETIFNSLVENYFSSNGTVKINRGSKSKNNAPNKNNKRVENGVDLRDLMIKLGKSNFLEWVGQDIETWINDRLKSRKELIEPSIEI